MLEKDIERKLSQLVKDIGGLCLKFETPAYTGVPDRIILLPGGRVKFVEMKKPGKTERARQIYVQSILRKLGFTVYSTVDSQEKIDRIVEDCRKEIADAKTV